MAGFNDQKREARLRKVARERGIGAVKLTRALRRRMTPKSRRPAEPEQVGLEDPQRGVVLSYSWVVEQFGRGASPADMARLANITQIEMDRVLSDYELDDREDTHRRCGL